MKKVLVAIDIGRSGGNEKVITTAQAIASAVDGELYLVHVVEPIPRRVLPEIPEEVIGLQEKHAEEKLQEIMAQYECANGVVRDGAPSTQILEYAEEIDADLIVLHSHDPDMTDYFLGSVAARVVRHAHCSVHVLREAKSRN